MIPNLIWSALFLTPLVIFCFYFMNPMTTYILIAISLVPLFFPNSFYDRIQLSSRVQWYRKIGVRFLNKFAQHGSIVNRILERRYPGFRVINKTSASIRKQYYQTYFYEKFHFSFFLFFTIATVYAYYKKQFNWALIITICNVLYNIYPNLLQQYIRVKLKSGASQKELL